MSYFTPAGSGGLPPAPVTVIGATARVTVNVSMPVGGTEYFVTLPVGCRQFMMKLRDPRAPLQVTEVLGNSGTIYDTIPRCCFYADQNLNLTVARTLYFQSSSPLQTLEVVYWT